jgi:hypothetical protein
LDIVKLEAIQPTGKAKIQVGPRETVELDTYTFIFDDNGTKKAAVVGCKPEHNKAVGKALLKRIYPLRKDPELEVGNG